MRILLDEANEAEPVTVAEAKLAAKIDADLTDDDDLVAEWIAAAREMLETRLDRSFLTTSWKLYLDAFPCKRGGLIELPRGPLAEIGSIRYVDESGDWQTLDEAAYQVDAVSRPARLMPAYGETWPATRAQMNAVEIAFDGGVEEPEAVEKRVKAAIYLAVAYWNEHRNEAELKQLDQATTLGIERLVGSLDDGGQRLAGVHE